MIRTSARRRALAACAAVFALGAAWFGARAPRGASAGASSRRRSPDPIETAREAIAAPATDEAPPTRVARALEGTEVDGTLAVDTHGHLRVTAETKALFDYFLMETGELDDPAIRALVEHEARARVHEPALSETMALYDRYGAFRRSAALEPAIANAPPPARVTALRALRRSHFGEAAATAFFAREEALEARIVSIPPAAPPSAAPIEPLDLEARRRSRTEAFGAAAAARLAQMDDDDAAWKRRLEQYRAERDAIARAHPGDDAAIEALRVRMFDAEERRRVGAIERIEAGR